MQVGDNVWIFDSNRRRYVDFKGNKLTMCWYRGHFDERYIVGETKQSWLVGYKGSLPDNRLNLKVNKKTLQYSTTNTYGLDGKLYISEEEVEQTCWIHDNHYKIREKVDKCDDYEKLKKIEEIINS